MGADFRVGGQAGPRARHAARLVTLPSVVARKGIVNRYGQYEYMSCSGDASR